MPGCGEHAHGYAELRNSRGQLCVDGDEAQVARGFDVGVDCVFEQRCGDAGDGDDSEQGHLQAGVEEAAGADGEQAECGEADGVEWAAFAVDETREQVEGDHPERTLHGRGEAGEERIGEGT